MSAVVTTSLRGRDLNGTVAQGDAIAFSFLFMSEDERRICQGGGAAQPRPMVAHERMKARLSERLESLTSELGSADEANTVITREWLEAVIYLTEFQQETRNAILLRIMEIFPDIPKEWVYWDKAKGLAGHRLAPMELLLALIIPAIQSLNEEDSTESVDQIIKAAGYKAATSIIGKPNQPKETPPVGTQGAEPAALNVVAQEIAPPAVAQEPDPAPSLASPPAVTPAAESTAARELLEALKTSTPERRQQIAQELLASAKEEVEGRRPISNPVPSSGLLSQVEQNTDEPL